MSTTGPGQSAQLLLEIVRLLEAAGAGYAVIGALAASYHGVVRTSLDADALVFHPREAPEALAERFVKGGFGAQLRKGDAEDPIPGMIVVSDAHGNRVDLLLGLRGLDPDTEKRVRTVSYDGMPLRVVGLEDFIAMKLFAGGPQDLEDARHAIAVSGTLLDRALARSLARRFGAREAELLDGLLAPETGPS